MELSKLIVGSQLPKFELLDQNQKLVKSVDLIGKPIVIFFYPKDNTPICTKEACSFRNHFEEFENLDAQVIGISSDSVESHQKFATRYNLPFSLLSDEHREVEKLFGLERALFGLLASRVTFIFDKNGILRHTFDSRWSGSEHTQEALAALSADK